MSNEKLDGIKVKIKNLLALADSASKIGNLAEAETALAKAQELLLKYNLEKAEIFDHGDETEQTLISDRDIELCDLGWKKNEAQFTVSLINVIARYNLCKIVHIKTASPWGGRVAIFGEQDNIDMVIYIHIQLQERIRHLGKKEFTKYEWMGEKKNTFMRGFLMGAVNGISLKLRTQYENFQNNEAKGNQLIRATDQLIKEAIEDRFAGGLTSGKSKALKGVNAAALGFAAGKNMEIHKGVGSSQITKQLNQ